MTLENLNYKRGLLRLWGIASVTWAVIMGFLAIDAEPVILILAVALPPAITLDLGYLVAWILQGFNVSS